MQRVAKSKNESTAAALEDLFQYSAVRKNSTPAPTRASSTPSPKNSSDAPRKELVPAASTELPPPVNHVFVDFENVHQIDQNIIGGKTVTFTLLLGPKQTKLDVSLVEKLIEHAASVHLIRITSAGKNALDFTLAYYVGRAVAADPTGFFHIVSKDAGYDPLIEHLRNKHIRARRHDSFATLTFAGPAKSPTPTPPAAAPELKSASKSKAQPRIVDERAAEVLEHFRKPSATRPRSRKKLVSFLVAYFGRKITEPEALSIVEDLRQASHLAIGEKGAVTYLLEPK